jgi:hypothetical protein
MELITEESGFDFWQKHDFFLHSVQTVRIASEVHPAPYSMDNGIFTPEVKKGGA